MANGTKSISNKKKLMFFVGNWLISKSGTTQKDILKLKEINRTRKIDTVLQLIFSIQSLMAIFVGVALFYLSDNVENTYVKLFSHEVGMAIVIAWVVWVFFEWAVSKKTEVEWADRIEKITKNVFFGVFRRRLPEKLIDEATRLVLEQSFIRSHHNVSYTLKDESSSSERGKLDFVILHASACFDVTNVGNLSLKYTLHISLPDPLLDCMRDYVDVDRMAWKRAHDDDWTEINLSESRERFKSKLSSNKEAQVVFEGDDIFLSPDETVKIAYSYTMAKESEDSEMLEQGIPCSGITVSVTDTAPSERIIRARSVHPTRLDNTASRSDLGQYSYRLDRYMLPHQGVLLWWKRNQNPAKVPAMGTESKKNA